MQSALLPAQFLTMMMISAMADRHMHMEQIHKMREQNLLHAMMDQQHTYSYSYIVYMSRTQQGLMQDKSHQMKRQFSLNHFMTQTATYQDLKNKDRNEFAQNQTYTQE